MGLKKKKMPNSNSTNNILQNLLTISIQSAEYVFHSFNKKVLLEI